VERRFSPLDEELGLLPGALTPYLSEVLVHLSTWIPSFAHAARLLKTFTGAEISAASVRRRTEGAGAAYVAVQEEEVVAWQRGEREEPLGAAKMVFSVDGALVPLVGQEWAEVKTCVIGEVPPWRAGSAELVKTERLSYFSRLAEARVFQEQLLVETQRRGLATAAEVACVADGAEWIQRLVDFHRPDALRILDLPHAAEHLNQMGQAVHGEETVASQEWLREQLQQLQEQGPFPVLTTLRALRDAHPLPVLSEHLAYLEKRAAQMHYPTFRAAGWPIGSGMVESANKLLVEGRLKGSGMHWARDHVNPMVALRTVVFNDRWPEAWSQIATRLREQDGQCRLQRQRARQVGAPPQAMTPPGPVILAALPQQDSAVVACAALPGPRRPAADHPWRHARVGKARAQPWQPYEAPKL
jgi:hypothetical protein